ncbi:MAG: response regulator transcription factor [Treponema sp.]|nr:response regulator transcription factor [Treponema sp.]
MDSIINILIVSRYVDEQKRVVAALSEQKEFFISGVEKDEAGAIIKSERLKPDILILDLQSIMMSLPDLARIIHRKSPSTSIIILCDNDDYVNLDVKFGISGLLLKEEDFNKLALIVKIIFLGGCYVNSSITASVLNALSLISQFPGQFMELDFSFYSPAEHAIVTMLAQGYSDEQIAGKLHYSAGTIRNCLTDIRNKTKMKSRIEIVIYSLVSGFIRLENLGIWKEKIDAIAQNNIGVKARTCPRVTQIIKGEKEKK